MDCVLLRKLTLKSTLKFGKYYDLSVNDVINSKGYSGLDYLTWVYYSSDMIDFFDDILDVLGILEENKISKPGKVTEKSLLYHFTVSAVKERILRQENLDENQLRAISGMSRKENNFNAKHDVTAKNISVSRDNFKSRLANRNRTTI